MKPIVRVAALIALPPSLASSPERSDCRRPVALHVPPGELLPYVTDLFAGLHEVMVKVVERGLDADTAAVFEEAEQLFTQQLEKLRASLASVDPTLAEALKGGREKILYQLSNLRTRFVHNRSKRDEATRHQIERAFAVLYPNKSLQEREINVTYFLARYGYELIDRLYEEVEVGFSNHKLVYL